MKKHVIVGSLLSIFAAPSWSETLVRGHGLEGPNYQKFTDVPFTGKTIGEGKVSIKNGVVKPEGTWFDYYDNGQLFIKSNYKNGKREGAWVGHYKNGQLLYKGRYKNNLSDGPWFFYSVDGTLIEEPSGNYKGGEKISD